MDRRFEGVWRIEEMELWGSNDLDLLGPANITFDDDGLGSVQFVAAVGLIDCHFTAHTRSGHFTRSTPPWNTRTISRI